MDVYERERGRGFIWERENGCVWERDGGGRKLMYKGEREGEKDTEKREKLGEGEQEKVLLCSFLK